MESQNCQSSVKAFVWPCINANTHTTTALNASTCCVSPVLASLGHFSSEFCCKQIEIQIHRLTDRYGFTKVTKFTHQKMKLHICCSHLISLNCEYYAEHLVELRGCGLWYAHACLTESLFLLFLSTALVVTTCIIRYFQSQTATDCRKYTLSGAIRSFHKATVKVLNCNDSHDCFPCEGSSYLLQAFGPLPLKDRCAYCIV